MNKPRHRGNIGLAELPERSYRIRLRCIFESKSNFAGNVARKKSRTIAKGFMQQYGAG